MKNSCSRVIKQYFKRNLSFLPKYYEYKWNIKDNIHVIEVTSINSIKNIKKFLLKKDAEAYINGMTRRARSLEKFILNY